MTHLAIVADDLTGAADSAGYFAVAGLSTAIPLGGAALPDADVWSISTDSRDIPEPAAEAAVRAAIERVLGSASPPRLIYKKLDSALRGHLRAELLAAMSALGERRAVVCPALPAEGRATIGGRQLVHGAPLEASSFGGPGVCSDLRAVFGGDDCPPVRLVDLATLRAESDPDLFRGEGLIVVDAEHDADLERIAAGALAAGVRLTAGSAGLAKAIARTANLARMEPPPPWRPARGRPILMIVGSRHDASIRQVARAQRTGVCVVAPTQQCLDRSSEALGAALATVERELQAGRNVVLTSAGLERSPLGAFAVADRLASVLESAVVRSAIGGLVLTGGDVAAAACRALGGEALWLRGEVQPALPWSTISGGRLPGLPVVTKAGSFGDDESLIAAAALLARATG